MRVHAGRAAWFVTGVRLARQTPRPAAFRPGCERHGLARRAGLNASLPYGDHAARRRPAQTQSAEQGEKQLWARVQLPGALACDYENDPRPIGV